MQWKAVWRNSIFLLFARDVAAAAAAALAVAVASRCCCCCCCSVAHIMLPRCRDPHPFWVAVAALESCNCNCHGPLPAAAFLFPTRRIGANSAVCARCVCVHCATCNEFWPHKIFWRIFLWHFLFSKILCIRPREIWVAERRNLSVGGHRLSVDYDLRKFLNDNLLIEFKFNNLILYLSQIQYNFDLKEVNRITNIFHYVIYLLSKMNLY